MAQDSKDTKTIDMFNPDEKEILKQALDFYAERLGRKASADSPKAIKELWAAEVQKVNNLYMRINAA